MDNLSVDGVIFGLVMSVVGGLVTAIIIKLYSLHRQKNLKADKEYLLLEKEVLQGMQKSSIQLNRTSFRSLFAILMVLSFGLFVTALEKMLFEISKETLFFRIVELGVYGVCIAMSAKCHKRYDHLKDMKSALAGLDKKIEVIESKIK